MAQVTSGKVLHEARERKGYDLTTVARRLRIRPDILRAIEANDFSAMPPRGYTRNMVNAYARLLGLNPTEIVNMYLDEAYADQVKQARGNAPSSGFNMERDHLISRSRSRGLRDVSGSRDMRTTDSGSLGRASYDEQTGRYTRTLYDDRTQFSRDDYGLTRERTTRPGRSDRDFLSHHSGYPENFSVPSSSQRRMGRDIHVGETPMHYTASRVPKFLQSRTVLIVLAAIVVLIVVFIILNVLGGHRAEEASDVSQLPVAGINDTTGKADNDEATGLVEIAPTSARVSMTVKQGEECYLESHLDNVTTPYMMTGPAEENIEVTGVWTITTFAPDNVSIKVDGVEVKLETSEEYGGMYAYTVDFPAILEQWRKTHTSKEAQRSAALANATGDSASSASADAAAPEAGTTESEAAAAQMDNQG